VQALAQLDTRKLSESVSDLHNILDPIRSMIPALERLPSLFAAVEGLQKVQDMAERSLKQNATNQVQKASPCIMSRLSSQDFAVLPLHAERGMCSDV
jgi:hypothetical protein